MTSTKTTTTSSWPWMKDVGYALVDKPIDPVNEHDIRPTVHELVEQKRDKIDKVRTALKDDPLFDEAKHDDLWILRFILSHKKSKEAAEAAKECLAFRQKYKLDEEDIRSTDYNEGPCKKYADACDGTPTAKYIPDPQRGIVQFLFYRYINQQRLLDELSKEDLLLAMIHSSEWAFQNLDYITRTTGRLTKSIRLMDCEGFSMSQLRTEQFRRESECSGITANVYPQMSDSIFFCNAPSWAQIPWRMLRPLAPKRVVSKIDFLNPRGNVKERRRLLQYMSDKHLPSEFGGQRRVSLHERNLRR